MARNTIRVKGLREFQRACAKAPKEARKEVRKAFRKVGELVRADARERLSEYDGRSARALRVRVNQRGVWVGQSLRKTTGAHPEWGELQMTRALRPALDDKRDEAERELELALDVVADRFGRF